MNKLVFLFLATLCCAHFSFGQDDDKVKGDRNVTIKQTYIDPFSKIVVGEDFEVEIIYNSRASVEIETDDNLHEYLQFGVVDGVLSFRTTKRITSSKKMHIKVNYTDGLESIETRDDGELRSLTSLELGDVTLNSSGSSKAYLNIKAKSFTFTALDKSKSKLNITAENSVLNVGDNCKVELTLNSKTTKMDLYQKATVDMEGSTNNLDITLDVSSRLNGKGFSIGTCNLDAQGNSDATVWCTESLNVSISGDSSVYVYGDGKITLNKFTDSAKLQKKQL